MTIAEAREKCKGALAKIPRDILMISIIFLASGASFALGYLAGIDAERGQGDAAVLAPIPEPPGTAAQVVASDGGTKYYVPSCVGAKAISEAHKVWFASPEAAEAAGYTRATNCASN